MKKILLTVFTIIILLFSQIYINFAEEVSNKNGAIFSDIDLSHKNFSAIQFLKNIEIIKGYPDGTFKPKNPVVRAEIAKILVEAKMMLKNGKFTIGEKGGIFIQNDVSQEITLGNYKNCFSDVTNQWFAPYVCYAKELGWINGYPDGTFKPENEVAKVEAVKMIININGLNVNEPGKIKIYEDTKVDVWYNDYLQSAFQINLLEEIGGKFNPGIGMTRETLSEMIFRAITLKMTKEEVFSSSLGRKIENIQVLKK